jgi:hypothetical protein
MKMMTPLAMDFQKSLSWGIKLKFINPANSIGPTPCQRVKLKYMESANGYKPKMANNI